jgi:hypothetical protein
MQNMSKKNGASSPREGLPPRFKYRPEMPAQFGSLQHAPQVVRDLVDWYNGEHYHDSLALLHAVDVHHGRTDDIVAARQRLLDDVHRRHPERFVHGSRRRRRRRRWRGSTFSCGAGRARGPRSARGRCCSVKLTRRLSQTR